MSRMIHLVAAVVALAGSARAQAAKTVDLTDARTDLRALVSPQEAHYSDAGTYTNQLAQLKATLTSGVTISIVEAGTRGWSAMATVEGIKGSCVIFVGGITAPKTSGGSVPEKEAQPVCDMVPEPAVRKP